MDKSVAKCIPKLSRRQNDSWSDVETVEDVLANILSRLPVKCLIRSKAVSRLWHKLISSPYFTKLHLMRSRENVIYILYPYMDDIKELHLVDGDGVTTEVITLPGFENVSSLSMICSYNGLICFTIYPWFPHLYMSQPVEEDLEILICNPATREIRLLPRGSPAEQELGIGVAFGPGTSDYRVFRFFSSIFEKPVVSPQCEIFSSSTGTWRGIGFVQQYPMGANHVFFNGQVYWFIASEEDHSTPGSILSVDMEDSFKTIELPEEVTAHSFLIILEGFLSLVAVYDDDLIMDVWMLKDANESYWEKKCSAYIEHAVEECIDSVAGRNNEFFFITTEHYFIFNTDRTTWEQLYLQEGFGQDSPVVFTYTESLLPCKYYKCFQFIIFSNG